MKHDSPSDVPATTAFTGEGNAVEAERSILTLEERRARRQERREKQREADAGRALKMLASSRWEGAELRR